MALFFYHGHGSPYSWRVWLALEQLRVPYELKVLSFSEGDTRKPEFVAINPRHTVPTIVDDGWALWESEAILEYLDERFASGAPVLYPGDARSRARVRRLSREAQEYLNLQGVDRIVDEYFWKGDAPPDEAKLAEARERVATELAYFAKELRGDYLAGSAPSAADLVLYPMVAYVKRVTQRKPESKLTELIPPPIAAWAARIEAMPYFDKTFPPHWRG
ncbi:MAG TPA: glutathione S-transferase family protein [Usitatibacter sp.]|jgi:glutathione S-transferase|nr:glutathione S-transferase family protein [Usitatibacter sp.]